MLILETVHSHQRFPKVICPGCQQLMSLKDLRPVLFTTSLYSGTYRCQQCGFDTKRQFKDGRDKEHPSHRLKGL